MSVPGPAKVLFNGPLKTLKRQTQMCVRAPGQRRLTDLKQEEGCEGMLEDKTAARRKVERVRGKKENACEKRGGICSDGKSLEERKKGQSGNKDK